MEYNIGKNIRDVRKKNGLSQEKLANLCDFSNTTLSQYENNKKTPSLFTIARIAKELNVSIERLFYGDENDCFIESESNEGKKTVNSVYLLWSLGIIDYYENYSNEVTAVEYNKKHPKGIYIFKKI